MDIFAALGDFFIRAALSLFLFIAGAIGILSPSPATLAPENNISPPPVEIKESAASPSPRGENEEVSSLPRAEKMAEKPPLSATKSENVLPVQSSLPPALLIDGKELNEKTRAALVNILCTTKTAGSLEPLSGSGVMIDTRGVILTNAHVAQYFLLKDYRVPDFLECVIRGGAPAEPLYRADILYISPTWIKNNAAGIVSSDPLGTGENDFALLRITASARPNSPLPSFFSSLDMDFREDALLIGTPVFLAGYPAGFLGGITVQKTLWPVTTFADIRERLTFSEGIPSLDIVSVGGTLLSQKGSSGGGALRRDNGKLIGIFVTSTNADMTSGRDLRAITLSHINRSMQKDTGEDLLSFLSGNTEEKARDFASSTTPSLRKLLVEILEK